MADDFSKLLSRYEPHIKNLSSRYALPNFGLTSDDLAQSLRLLLLELHLENRTHGFFKDGEILGDTIKFLRRSANRIKMKEYRRWHPR